MKICVLAPEFVPAWGGAGTYVQELITHLPKSFEIHVVAPKREGFGPKKKPTIEQAIEYNLLEEIGSNVHIQYISTADDTFLYNANFQYACFKYVPKLLKEQQIEIIHAHMSHMSDLPMRLRQRTIPTIVTLHNTIKLQRSAIRFSEQPFGSLGTSEKAVYLLYPILSLTEEVYLRGSKRLIAPSRWIRNEVLRLSYFTKDGDKFSIVPNSVDVDACKKIANLGRQRLAESFDNKRIVLYCGRLLANKGTDLLVESIPRILREINDKLLFVFAGPGDSDQYARKLKESGVPEDSFLFTGSISRTKCIQMLGCTEILILPSFLENCPYVILEAMACDVPVIASNVGGIPEIIQDGQNGMTFQQGVSLDLSEKVITLLQDRSLQRKFAQQAQVTVSNDFSWESNLKKQIGAYEATLN